MLACREGKLACIQQLLASDANVNHKSLKGVCAFQEVCMYGSKSGIKLLLQHGADANTVFGRMYRPLKPDQEIQGTTAIIWACQHGQGECVKVLLENGASMDVQNSIGATGLHMACHNGFADCAQLLIEAGCNYNLRTNEGGTALLFAKTLPCIELLVSHGADLDAQDVYGQTALINAGDDGKIDVVKFLLSKRANTKLTCIQGCTAFQWAIQSGHKAVAKLLWDYSIESAHA